MMVLEISEETRQTIDCTGYDKPPEMGVAHNHRPGESPSWRRH